MTNGIFKAGAGTARISFARELFPLEGFQKVHDKPAVRTLVLDAGEKAALLSIELVLMDRDDLETLKELVAKLTAVPAGHIWIHATHAISTPHPPRAPDKKALYWKALTDAVRQSATGAMETLRDARWQIQYGTCDLNCNRDVLTPAGWWIGKRGDGPSNKQMAVVRVNDASGVPIAILMNYGVKPSVLDNSGMEQGARVVSADFTGRACSILEERYHAPVLFLMSAAGDQNPAEIALYDVVSEDGTIQTVDLGIQKGLELAEELGTRMAEAAVPVIEAAGGGGEETSLQCADISFDWTCLERQKPQPGIGKERKTAGSETVEIKLIKMGSLALVGCRPELNCATEQQVKAASPIANTLLVSMVNGAMKYMPDKLAYDNMTFEAKSSMLARGAAEQFVTCVCNTLCGIESEHK